MYEILPYYPSAYLNFLCDFHMWLRSWSISLKGPTRFQRRGPLKSAERSDETILNPNPTIILPIQAAILSF